jgi:hypothetical protein
MLLCYDHAGKAWIICHVQHYCACVFMTNYTAQQNVTFFFGPRGKVSNPNRTFNADFKCVSSFSPSPTVFFLRQPS